MGIHGNSALELEKLALKLLGQPSSSCAERNWSTYGPIHSTARNRKSAEYSSGLTRFWNIGGDTHDIFDVGAFYFQQAVLSLDEPEL